MNSRRPRGPCFGSQPWKNEASMRSPGITIEALGLFISHDADRIWFACGPDALDSLAARIETHGPAQPQADVFHLNTRIGTLVAPLIRVCEQSSQESGPVDPNQRQTHTWLLPLLRDLKDSTSNEDDSLSVNVHASDDALNATIKCHTGILRFFGEQIARFSKVNSE